MAGLILAAELLAIGAYFGLTGAGIRDVRYAIYPFIWINVGLWAVHRRPAPSAGRPAQLIAGGLAAGYFLVLANLTGLIAVHVPAPALSLQTAGVVPQLPVAHGGAIPTGWEVRMSPPGWGPRIAYVGEGWHAYFIPYRVLGYLALAYLVYGAVLETVGAALPAIIGVASCIGCTVPLAAPALLGVGGLVGLTTSGLSVDLSTVAFLTAVALLAWRPRVGRLPGSSR